MLVDRIKCIRIVYFALKRMKLTFEVNTKLCRTKYVDVEVGRFIWKFSHFLMGFNLLRSLIGTRTQFEHLLCVCAMHIHCTYLFLGERFYVKYFFIRVLCMQFGMHCPNEINLLFKQRWKYNGKRGNQLHGNVLWKSSWPKNPFRSILFVSPLVNLYLLSFFLSLLLFLIYVHPALIQLHLRWKIFQKKRTLKIYKSVDLSRPIFRLRFGTANEWKRYREKNPVQNSTNSKFPVIFLTLSFWKTFAICRIEVNTVPPDISNPNNSKDKQQQQLSAETGTFLEPLNFNDSNFDIMSYFRSQWISLHCFPLLSSFSLSLPLALFRQFLIEIVFVNVWTIQDVTEWTRVKRRPTYTYIYVWQRFPSIWITLE